MTEPLKAEAFKDPFRFLDAKLREFETQRDRAKLELKALGWILRPNHPVSMVWRARRHDRDGNHHLSAPTVDLLLELVRAASEARLKEKAARKEAARRRREERANRPQKRPKRGPRLAS